MADKCTGNTEFKTQGPERADPYGSRRRHKGSLVGKKVNGQQIRTRGE